jgi:hypothetical protein
VRYVVPRVVDSAQLLGSVDLGSCRPTVQTLQDTSPKGSGYCTQVALASDNPGYDVNATPPAALKKVIVAVGGAC